VIQLPFALIEAVHVGSIRFCIYNGTDRVTIKYYSNKNYNYGNN